VTAETDSYLEKARELLGQADAMLGIKIPEAAGRTAYLAGFHAAPAPIFERTGKVLKSHHGVHTEFLRLTKDDQRVEPLCECSCRKPNNLKSIADYETGPGARISADRAAAAVAAARHFVARMAELRAAGRTNS
jgi:uncharacterized protein (UPF0332 family)